MKLFDLYNNNKHFCLNKNVWWERRIVVGDYGYRQKPRDSLERHNIRSLKLFGIARNLDPVESEKAMGIFKLVPRISGGSIGEENLKKHPGQYLLNRGQVSSAVGRSSKDRIENKDLRRWKGEIKDAVNGRGHEPLDMRWDYFRPVVISSRGKHIGSLVVRKSSPYFEQIAEANRIAVVSLRDEKRADSCDRRPPLQPRIDVFRANSKSAAQETIDTIGNLLIAEEALLVLEPADDYEAT